jgi:AbrB family looped-hinge helix DNA binding protein
MYYNLKINSQNRITLPPGLRKSMNIVPGTKLYFETVDDRRILMSTKPITNKDLEQVRKTSIYLQ